jgi:hypothetical protein
MRAWAEKVTEVTGNSAYEGGGLPHPSRFSMRGHHELKPIRKSNSKKAVQSVRQDA